MLAASLVGCVTDGPAGASRIPPSALAWPADAAAYTQTQWQPNIGRMNESVWRRHRLAEPAESILWVDRFDRPDGQPPVVWTATGSPVFQQINIDRRTGLRISANPAGTSDCSLQRELNSDQLRGRDVRLSLTLGCNGNRGKESMRDVRISLASKDASGQTHEMFLPFAADVTPGWESIHWWMRFGSDLRSAVLRVHLLKQSAGITVGELRMIALDPPTELTGTHTQAKPNRPPSPSTNLIVGGDFETYRRCFIASLLRPWPNGEDAVVPLHFEFDTEAAVGEQSLRLRIEGGGTGRIGFGPVNLAPAERTNKPVPWHLKFYARSVKPTALTASLRVRGRTLSRLSVSLGPQWQAFTGLFEIPENDTDQSVLCSSELVLDILNRDPAGILEVWLDGISLTGEPIADYVQAEQIELGIAGPVPLTGDLSNIVAEEDAATFQVNLSANSVTHTINETESQTAQTTPTSTSPASAEPVGQLTLDLLDGWDRAIWTRTTEPVLGANGKYSEKVSLTLPRGYYRLLATLWSGRPGESQLISRDESAVAVVSFRDPVPMGNRFGLSTVGGSVSGYSTALGAGWVRMDLSAGRLELNQGVWDFAQWQTQLVTAKQANAEVVVGLTLPTASRFRRQFIEQWLANSSAQLIGLVVNPPAISTRPVEEYLEELAWIGQVLTTASPHTRLVCDLSALDLQTRERPTSELPRGANLAVGYASTEGGLPENSEPLLESIGKRYMGDLRVWDLGVPVRLGGAGEARNWRIQASRRGLDSGAVSRLEMPLDPVLSASRMVRSLLIRSLAGVQLACCEATALSGSVSVFDDSRQWLHERNLTPRPAMVAFERMTSLLNDATLGRWIDQPGGVRILFFEKDDGGAVVVTWRAFGLQPTRLSLPKLPAGVLVLDCLGQPVAPVNEGDSTILEINEMVQYLVAPVGKAKALSDAVGAALIQSDSQQSQPDAVVR